MIIIRNRILPFKGYDAINLMGVLLCHKDVAITASLLRHERIHTAQMREMLYVFFYLWYGVEWLVRLPMQGNAYMHISFEREAYENMYDRGYLASRKHYAWMKWLK